MSANPTPGPWVAEYESPSAGYSGWAIREADNMGLRSIASIADVDFGKATAAANARLIAKAPALLDAIRETIEKLETWAACSVVGGWSTHQVDAMRKRADELRRLL